MTEAEKGELAEAVNELERAIRALRSAEERLFNLLDGSSAVARIVSDARAEIDDDDYPLFGDPVE